MKNVIPVLLTVLVLAMTLYPVVAEARPVAAGGMASATASSPPVATPEEVGTSEPAIVVLDAPIDFGGLVDEAAGVGGPEEEGAEDALSSDAGVRWRITAESREERRSALPARASLNAIVIRF